ncbi:NADP-dependent oxidoreductase domain-containing protein [Mycena olivaceomarginata]|nr:NADP-dependent oxidoreductase domain-containing protein [Mycena olivaceomarginata]
MTFGDPGIDGARVDNVQDIEAILDVFVKHEHTEVDTARSYSLGTSETILGKTNWQEKGITIASKLYPPHPHMLELTAPHTAEGLRKAVLASLKNLNTDKLDIYYLHGPDRSVPYEVTLKVIDELYREGLFRRFGISNYMSCVRFLCVSSPPPFPADVAQRKWEVAEIVGICMEHGYVQPVVYQGIYNVIHRLVEPELFPALRNRGGIFTDRYISVDAKPETGSRFDPERYIGMMWWISPHALRAAPCDAAVVGAAPQRLRICALPCSVDADVPGAPAPFPGLGVFVARVLRTHLACTPGTEHEPLGTAKSVPLNVAPEPARFQSSASSCPDLRWTRPGHVEGRYQLAAYAKWAERFRLGERCLLCSGAARSHVSDDNGHGPSSRSPCAPILELAHGTPIPRVGLAARALPLPSSSSRTAPPIPRSSVRTTHGGMGVGLAARALPPSSSCTAPRSCAWTHGAISRLDDTRRHGASVLQARALPPSSSCRAARSVVWTTHGGTGVGSAARTLPPSSSRTAPQSRVWITYDGAGVGLAARALPPNLHHLLELTHGTPTPRSDDTRTRRRGRRSRSRSPRSHLTCTIPAGNCSHYVWTSARSRHTLAAHAQAQLFCVRMTA